VAVTEDDFDGAVEAFRRAQDAFLKRDPVQVLELFTRRDDATLANPLGPPQVGWEAVAKATREAAANFTNGSIRFEELSRYTTADLGYTVELEWIQVQMAGSDDVTPMSLRATMIFRREGDTWKVVHRHADAITTAQSVSTIKERTPRIT
jgi:ketosteroid isomerase-like protein